MKIALRILGACSLCAAMAALLLGPFLVCAVLLLMTTTSVAGLAIVEAIERQRS